MKGITCKDLGDNISAGKRKALGDGPWMISKELLLVMEFDETKSMDKFDFSFVPI